MDPYWRRPDGCSSPAACRALPASFFIGQPRVFADGPFEPLTIRAIPVLMVIAAMFCWGMRLSRRPLSVAQGRP